MVNFVRAEYGVYWDEKAKGNRRGAIDIVVWRPEKKNDAVELWGKSLYCSPLTGDIRNV